MKHLAWYAHHASAFLETPLSERALSECINSLTGLGSLACSCVQLKVTDIAKCICHFKKKKKATRHTTETQRSQPALLGACRKRHPSDMNWILKKYGYNLRTILMLYQRRYCKQRYKGKSTQISIFPSWSLQHVYLHFSEKPLRV